jgi:hypothetical protein
MRTELLVDRRIMSHISSAWCRTSRRVGLVAARLLDPGDDVAAMYGLGQSLRRGYATRTMIMGISDPDQKRLAQWRFVETSEGRTPKFQGGTKEIYAGINLMLNTLLRAINKL